jgi:hypothetical protein
MKLNQRPKISWHSPLDLQLVALLAVGMRLLKVTDSEERAEPVSLPGERSELDETIAEFLQVCTVVKLYITQNIVFYII